MKYFAIALGVLVIGGAAFFYFAPMPDSERTPTSADNAPPGSIHNLPVPAAVSAVKKYAAKEFSVAEGLVIVMTAYEKEWSDSCLGLGGAAESCASVMTPGWEISVTTYGNEATYRSNADGSSIRREK
jgi:hypothetical protein